MFPNIFATLKPIIHFTIAQYNGFRNANNNIGQTESLKYTYT